MVFSVEKIQKEGMLFTIDQKMSSYLKLLTGEPMNAATWTFSVKASIEEVRTGCQNKTEMSIFFNSYLDHYFTLCEFFTPVLTRNSLLKS